MDEAVSREVWVEAPDDAASTQDAYDWEEVGVVDEDFKARSKRLMRINDAALRRLAQS